jgi:hypothetical protein
LRADYGVFGNWIPVGRIVVLSYKYIATTPNGR